MREIHSVQELQSYLEAGNSLKDTVVQSVDATGITDLILKATIDNMIISIKSGYDSSFFDSPISNLIVS